MIVLIGFCSLVQYLDPSLKSVSIMRSIKKIAMAAGWACALFLYSCETQDEVMQAEQPVQFSVVMSSLPPVGGRVGEINSEDVAAVVVSIKDATNTLIVTSKKLILYDFNGKFISEPVALKPGNYFLSEFFVIDRNNKVIFACPVAGSTKAYLVLDPLDIKVPVIKNKVTEITPEVLAIGESHPQDFGYTTFSFKETATFDFPVSVFVYDKQQKKLVLTSAMITITDMTQSFIYTKELLAVTNRVTLPERYSSYKLKVVKSGYQTYLKTFNISSLKNYNDVNGPLMITLVPGGNLIFWNKLGSDEEVLNSAVGPDLVFFSGGDGLHVPANREYVTGKSGNAITIAPGSYSSTNRVHNLVLNDLPSLINPERGAIECFFFQNSSPVAYDHNPYRIFDGQYGFLSKMGFVSHDFNEDGKINALTFYLDLGSATPVSVSYMTFGSFNGQWVHVAAVWDRSGIGYSQETMQLYINGAKVAATTAKGWGTSLGQQADIAGGNDNNIARQFYVDELKIYDFAKIDF